MAAIGQTSKPNLLRLVSKYIKVVDFGVNSLRVKFKSFSSTNGWDRFLVPFLATIKAVALLANDSILLGILIWLFNCLKHQNLSTGDDFIDISKIIFIGLFSATREDVAPLVNYPTMSGRLIWFFTHLEHQNLSIILDFIDRGRMGNNSTTPEQNDTGTERGRKRTVEHNYISWYSHSFNIVHFRLPHGILKEYDL